MIKENNNKEVDQLLEARESYSGRLLTNSQFVEAIAITGIMAREIHKSGTFKQKLGDYAHAYARTESIDAMRGENTIRDLFKARYGQTMNQMRENLINREDQLLGVKNESTQIIKPNISKAQEDHAYQSATDIGQMIKGGNKMSFHRAHTQQAEDLAKELGITEVGAKCLMKEQFALTENSDLYKWGKEVEDKYYRPQIEAEKEARNSAPEKQVTETRQRSRSRS